MEKTTTKQKAFSQLDEFLTSQVGFCNLKNSLYRILLDSYSYQLHIGLANPNAASDLDSLRGLLETLSEFNEDDFDLTKKTT